MSKPSARHQITRNLSDGRKEKETLFQHRVMRHWDDDWFTRGRQQVSDRARDRSADHFQAVIKCVCRPEALRHLDREVDVEQAANRNESTKRGSKQARLAKTIHKTAEIRVRALIGGYPLEARSPVQADRMDEQWNIIGNALWQSRGCKQIITKGD